MAEKVLMNTQMRNLEVFSLLQRAGHKDINYKNDAWQYLQNEKQMAHEYWQAILQFKSDIMHSENPVELSFAFDGAPFRHVMSDLTPAQLFSSMVANKTHAFKVRFPVLRMIHEKTFFDKKIKQKRP